MISTNQSETKTAPLIAKLRSAIVMVGLIIGQSGMVIAQQADPPPANPPQSGQPSSQQPLEKPNNSGNNVMPATIKPDPDKQRPITEVLPAISLPMSAPPIAPDYKAPRRPLPNIERVGVDPNNRLLLRLDEAILMALENNKDITAARIETRIAQFNLLSSQGIYDPRFATETFFERSNSPVSSLLGGGNGKVMQRTATGSLRLSGLTPKGGGNYQLDFTASRLSTDNQFVALTPQFPSALTLSYTQPLFRGRKIDDNRRNISIAKKNLDLTDAQFRQRVIETITNVERAYWDLAYALRNLNIQIDGVTLGLILLESSERLVAEGMLPASDLVSSQAQVTLFEQNVYLAQEAVTRAENSLKALVLPDRNSAVWSQVVIPTSPVALPPPEMALDPAIELALRNRPEVAQLAANVEINEINQQFFRDQTKPQLDLVGVYTATGLAGNVVAPTNNALSGGNAALINRLNELSRRAGLPNVVIPTNTASIPGFLTGNLNDSLGNLFGQRFTTARLGVRLSFPIRNRVAEANLGRVMVEKERLKNQREQTEQNVAVEVRNALQVMRSAQSRLAAAAASRAATEQQFNSEKNRFEAGLANVFFVLQRQAEVAVARGRELQAQIDLNKAIAEFNRIIGSTLQVYNVSVSSK
jgi:outer membrane protein TolC